MPAKKFEILVLNQISPIGLKRFPAKVYNIAKDAAHPDAILVRSADMNAMKIPDSVRAIGRAGAGTNNIPVKDMSGRGVPVFNAPGANANAVKELVLAGMLMAARNLVPAVRFVHSLNCDDDALSKRVEAEKKQFAGIELPQQTLGVIRVGYEAPDLAEADDAERLLRQLDPGELLLLRLDALGESVVVAIQRVYEPDRGHQIARGHQHPGEHQLLHRVRVRAGGIEHRHAAPAHVLNGNVVRARTGAADRAHAVGNLHRVHVGRAHQDRVGVHAVLGDVVNLRRKALQADRGDLVEDQ